MRKSILRRPSKIDKVLNGACQEELKSESGLKIVSYLRTL